MHSGSRGPARPLHRPASAYAVPAKLAALLLLTALTGCSLISIKSPERPLSARDMNARILTRELTTHFIAANGRNTDNILATETDPAVINNVLRWEVGVIITTRNAETQLSPLMSLLDTWALALQLQGFVSPGGPGGKLFGAHQAAVRTLTDNYADGVHALARSLLTTQEFADYQTFIDDYVRAHPLQDLRFARASVVQEWGRAKGAKSSLLDEVCRELTAEDARAHVALRQRPLRALDGNQRATRESARQQHRGQPRACGAGR